MEQQMHRTQRPLPTEDELLVLSKVMGVCLHETWVVEDHKPARSAICERCGHAETFDCSSPDERVTDADVKVAMLKSLPRPGSDELYANSVVRKLDTQGWEMRFSMHGNSDVACSLSKGAESFRSGLHKSRAPAIVKVVVQMMKAGQFPR